ncbi:MAG: hypothetical protein J6V38_04125 [Kiritimatiellae bacterium]|nr:hypothetical protein [Kiritimatiellia bacterium]
MFKNKISAVLILTILSTGVVFAQGFRRNLLSPRGEGAGAAPAAAASMGTGTAEVAALKGLTGDASSDLNFKEAALDIVFEAYSQLVGRTVLKDPSVQSVTITIQSAPGQKLTKEEQIFVIEEALEMNGVHMENYGEKFVRALPRDKVRQEGIPLILDEDAELPDDNKVVSIFVTFKNIPVEEAKTALEGLKSPKGLLLVYERIGKILVTDTRMNINRMREVARQIDVGTPVNENVFVRQIVNASAAEIKVALELIVQESQKALENQGVAARNAQGNYPYNRYPMMYPGGYSRMPLNNNGNLLRRPNQPGNQPAQPVNVESKTTSVSDADRGLIRGKVLIMSDERSNKLIVVTAKTNMDFFDKVIKELDVETTPDTQVKVYRLKYAEAEDVSDMINELIGNASSSSGKGNQNQAARSGTSGNLTRSTSTANRNTATQRTAANQRSGDAKAGELTKDNTVVLADKRINGLVVMTQKELVPTIEKIIESMDIKLSQVLIETVIIEVNLGDGLKTGIDWFHQTSKGRNYNMGLAGGGGTGSPRPDANEGKKDGENELPADLSLAEDVIKYTPTGAGINYLVSSKKLDLTAIITASKTDSRAKYLASPIVMTVDNKEATIEATQSYQLLTGWSAVSGYNGSGMPSPNYSAKELGITLKIKPKINPNGTVMLNVEEEYSQIGGKQDMLMPKGSAYTATQVDVSLTRKMTSDIILENNQSVILGGLITKNLRESESGIPILKDIPYVGKWLFGSTETSEERSELLIFMTPYVLDDADAAKVEAIRRKKTLSDPNPWDDAGWSASDLSDGVSKKEQLRRLKDEWEKQDEERKTRIAIEQEKVKRAKQLEKLSEEERALWIKMHKEELDKERQEELEEQMLDGKSQEALKKLAGELRAKQLAKAEEDIKKAEADEKKAAQESDASNGAALLDDLNATPETTKK